MENAKEEKPIPNEPHVTILGQEIGTEPKSKDCGSCPKSEQGKNCGRGRCACGRYDRCQCGGGIFGLLVVMAGVILLFNNFGGVPWEIWNAMFVFWPVLLVIAGLKLILGRSIAGRVVVGLFTLIVFGLVIVYGLVSVSSPFVSYLHLSDWAYGLINKIK